jgi:hypothetical protein
LRLRGAPARPARTSQHQPAHEAPVAVRKRGEWHTTSANRPPSLHSYPSDLTDQEWAILEPLLPLAKPGGRPRTSEPQRGDQCHLVSGSHRRAMAGLAA